MSDPDVDSLYTNIPLNDTINICNDNLYNGNEIPSNYLSMIFIICSNYLATKDRKILNISAGLKKVCKHFLVALHTGELMLGSRGERSWGEGVIYSGQICGWRYSHQLFLSQDKKTILLQ